MIYRIEFRKDGSVASCAEVESHLKDGGLVCYIAAESKTEAIDRAKSTWQSWRQKRLARLENGGLCSMCGKRSRVEGRVKCQHCLDLQKSNKRDLYRIKRDPDADLLIAMRAKAIADERRDSLDKATIAARSVCQTRAQARWDLGMIEPYERTAIRRILFIYDQDPTNFRERMMQLLEPKAQAAE